MKKLAVLFCMQSQQHGDIQNKRRRKSPKSSFNFTSEGMGNKFLEKCVTGNSAWYFMTHNEINYKLYVCIAACMCKVPTQW